MTARVAGAARRAGYVLILSSKNPRMTPSNVTHDKLRYDAGCRCTVCQSASTEYHRAKRLRRHATRVMRNGAWYAPQARVHSYSTYVNWGCRCDVCRSGHAWLMREQYKRRLRKRHPTMTEPIRPARTRVEGGRFDGITDITRLTDGRVMCCACFEYTSRDQLWRDANEQTWDICRSCGEREGAPGDDQRA